MKIYLCRYCKKPTPGHRQFCNSTCKYRFRRKNGFCVRCGRKNLIRTKTTYCDSCKAAARYQTAKQRGRNPDKDRATQKKYTKTRRQLLDSLKAGPCKDCGQVFPPYCMDLDHRDLLAKKFDPSQMYRRKLEDLLAEIAKCDLVCANCHRIRSHNQGF